MEGLVLGFLKPQPSILHPAPQTLNPTPYTLHPHPSTRYHTLYTPTPQPYTLHLTPHNLKPTPFTLHPNPSTLYIPLTLHLCLVRKGMPVPRSQSPLDFKLQIFLCYSRASLGLSNTKIYEPQIRALLVTAQTPNPVQSSQNRDTQNLTPTLSP